MCASVCASVCAMHFKRALFTFQEMCIMHSSCIGTVGIYIKETVISMLFLLYPYSVLCIGVCVSVFGLYFHSIRLNFANEMVSCVALRKS